MFAKWSKALQLDVRWSLEDFPKIYILYIFFATGMAKTRLHFMPGPTFLHRCVSERHILDIVSVYHNCECCCHYHLFWAFWNKLLSLNFSFIDVLRNMFVVQAQAVYLSTETAILKLKITNRCFVSVFFGATQNIQCFL